ncbi:hypothetical protein [Paenibacillus eucommiae]|uniref:Uncharacterized protein n=1 Tax=Paenibacillus eucommiae TaxID=1355755 RepID=A0ABS4IYG4_9BACL|nr:hypothetical protein [Paenibacillus eucommiae]MBP1991916.1 hypothetical protein [Paenibacillus eucommiae]
MFATANPQAIANKSATERDIEETRIDLEPSNSSCVAAASMPQKESGITVTLSSIFFIFSDTPFPNLNNILNGMKLFVVNITHSFV